MASRSTLPTLLFIAASAVSYAVPGGIDGATYYTVFESEDRWYHAVHLDLNNVELTPTAHYSPRLTKFWDIARQYQPVAAITGTFFAFENQKPVADVVIDGVQKAKGYRGSVLGVDWYGQARIFDVPTKTEADYTQYRYALRGMIRVVSNGEVNPNPKAQGFRDSRIWGRAPRTAIGLTPENKMVMVATTQNVTLSQLGRAMKTRGVTDAVALDGGHSTMLYYMGDVKVNYGRPLSTVFMVERKTPYDDLFKNYIKANNALSTLLPNHPWQKKRSAASHCR